MDFNYYFHLLLNNILTEKTLNKVISKLMKKSNFLKKVDSKKSKSSFSLERVKNEARIDHDGSDGVIQLKR